MQKKQHASGFLDLVASLSPTVQHITVTDLAARLATKPEHFHVIDVREQDEQQQSIPGALCLAKGVIERDIEKHIPHKQDELVLYCSGGYRSIIAAASLQAMGYTNVSSMTGGFREWLLAELPVDDLTA